MPEFERYTEQVERVLLGDTPRYTAAEAAARADVPVEFGLRIWRALGFPEPEGDEITFTAADVSTLRRIGSLLERGLIDERTAVRMARAMGRTMARLAQWQSDILISKEIDGDTPGTDEDIARVVKLAGDLLPRVEDLLVHVWRMQLAAAGNRALALAGMHPDTPVNQRSAATGFADLVSFTRLSRELNEAELADLVEWFEETADEVIAPYTARVVKTLGDEVLFAAAEPAEAAEIALRLSEVMAQKGEGPTVRVGMAYGPLLRMMGDVFGATVNLASRLTAIARPGTVLVDQAMAGLLDGAVGYEVQRIRRRPARGFGMIQPYALRRLSP